MKQIEAALFESAPYAMFYFDADTRLQRANQQARLLWGDDSATLLHRSAAEMITLGVDELTLREVAASGNPATHSANFTSASADQRYFDLTYTPVPAEDNGGVLVSISDVTSRERELAELRLLAQHSTAENEQFNTVLDHMTEGVLLIEPSGKVRYLNAAGRELAGVGGGRNWLDNASALNLTLRHLDGTPITDADHPVARTLGGSTLSDVELYFTDAHGNDRLLTIDGAAVYDDDGGVKLAVITARDITAVRQLELGYKAKSEELQAILDNLTEGVLVADANGNQIYLNQAGRLLTGFAAPALPNLATYQRARVRDLDGRLMDVAEYPISRCLRGEVFTDLPLYFSDGYGATRLLSSSGSSIKDEAGRVRLGVCIFRDITKSYELEHQLQERSDELQAVLDNLPDAVTLVEPDGQLRYRNPAHLAMLGASGATEPTAQFPRIELRTPTGEPVSAPDLPVNRVLRGEVFSGFELLMRSLDGRRRQISYAGTSIRDAAGHFRLGIIVGHDVTDQRQVEQLKDEFIAITSHELRTPLTTIKGYAQVMSRKLRRLDAASRAELVKPLTTNLERTERLIGMVNDLLDVSRIAAGRFEVNPQTIDLTALVAGCGEQMALTTALPVEVHTPDEPVLVQGEKRLLEQVLINLISNAIKYSLADGVVTIALAAADGAASVSVSDNGIGIAREEQEHLFERFYRSRQGQRKASGLGLGLYIASGVIKAHGGRIWVVSDGEGRGATFSFTLPLITA